MRKDLLTAAVEATKDEARNALQTMYDALNQGQQKKIVQNDDVRAWLDRFGVEYEE